MTAGLIPAHAGKTTSSFASPTTRRAHPRSRGENAQRPRAPVLDRGSSPLTRGKREAGAWFPRRVGLIPAHAGKTTVDRGAQLGAEAHPRSRGENP